MCDYVIMQLTPLYGILLWTASLINGIAGGKDDAGSVAPHVFIALQARNTAYLLPNFFGSLENLDYPKDRISLW